MIIECALTAVIEIVEIIDEIRKKKTLSKELQERLNKSLIIIKN